MPAARQGDGRSGVRSLNGFARISIASVGVSLTSSVFPPVTRIHRPSLAARRMRADTNGHPPGPSAARMSTGNALASSVPGISRSTRGHAARGLARFAPADRIAHSGCAAYHSPPSAFERVSRGEQGKAG